MRDTSLQNSRQGTRGGRKLIIFHSKNSPFFRRRFFYPEYLDNDVVVDEEDDE